ncbi:hypothetical protein [Candidatus Uabimicrobium sp. HlEnr_7]|uniref:hypothetical protein n=1 Tax=Candidatus Uabimicrobium helgolandensis TaxID=3095367 RepID=UPI0035578B1E
MRLEANTIGNIDNPSEDDIARAFENREKWDMADVMGNVYTLSKGCTSLFCISGHNFENFSLRFYDKNEQIYICSSTLSASEVKQYFIRFYNDDMKWYDNLDWHLYIHKTLWERFLEKFFRN